MPFGISRRRRERTQVRAGIRQAAEESGTVREVRLDSGEKADYVPAVLSPTGTGGYRRRTPVPPSAIVPPVPRNRLGFWHNANLNISNQRGTELDPPNRSPGWRWTLSSQRPTPTTSNHVPPAKIPIPRNGARMAMGWWQDQDSGSTVQGRPNQLPSMVGNWRWSRTRPSPIPPKQEPGRLTGPDQFTQLPAPEVERIDRLPDSPPPGPAVPPEEPFWRKMFTTIMEQQAGPTPQAPSPVLMPGPTTIVRTVPGAPVPAAAPFNMAMLLIPAALIGAVFLLKR